MICCKSLVDCQYCDGLSIAADSGEGIVGLNLNHCFNKECA